MTTHISKQTKKIKTKAIIFDMGNTLILDPFESVINKQAANFERIFKKYDISINKQEIISEWTKSNNNINYPYISHFSQEEPIIQDFLRRLKIPPDIAATLGPELLIEYRIGLKEVIESDGRVEEVRNTLIKLRKMGKKLGVFSNDRIIGLKVILKYMNIEELFEYIYASESIGIEKPHPLVFDHILCHLRLPPHQVTYVGDDPVRDIDAAKARGLNAILYLVEEADKYNTAWRKYDIKPKYKPDAVIKHFLEVLEVIE